MFATSQHMSQDTELGVPLESSVGSVVVGRVIVVY